jgi:hypothetical protein
MTAVGSTASRIMKGFTPLRTGTMDPGCLVNE